MSERMLNFRAPAKRKAGGALPPAGDDWETAVFFPSRPDTTPKSITASARVLASRVARCCWRIVIGLL